jgi:AcrR family transcriptional regulator
MYIRKPKKVNVAPVTSTQPKSSGRERSARGQGEKLRDDLLDAALGLLGAAGDPEDVSIRAVAKAAGVSPTAAYRHFANRDDLVAAACEHCFDIFVCLLEDATRDVEDPFVRLRMAGEAYLKFSTEDEGLYRTLFSNPIHMDKDFTAEKFTEPGADDGSAGKTAFLVLVDLVQACLDAGAPARGPGGEGPPDSRYLAFQVWTWLHGIVDLRITHPQLPWPDPHLMLTDLQRTLGLTRSS